MRPLIIDEDALGRAAGLKAYAEAHPVSYEQMRRFVEGLDEELVPGNRPEHQTHFDIGFKVVFTVEHHRHKSKQPPLRHISISVSGSRDAMPNPAAINEILKLFGFGGLNPAIQRVHIEELPDGKAISILQPME